MTFDPLFQDSIRNDLMQFLTASNTEMTELLTAKAESVNGTLEECDMEKLEVLEAIKYDSNDSTFNLQL